MISIILSMNYYIFTVYEIITQLTILILILVSELELYEYWIRILFGFIKFDTGICTLMILSPF